MYIGWIGYVWAIQWRLLDTVSSTCSLLVLLSAMEMTHTSQTALVLTHCTLLEIIRSVMCALCTLAAATFRGSVYFTRSSRLCNYYLRVVTIRGQHLFVKIWYCTPNSVHILESSLEYLICLYVRILEPDSPTYCGWLSYEMIWKKRRQKSLFLISYGWSTYLRFLYDGYSKELLFYFGFAVHFIIRPAFWGGYTGERRWKVHIANIDL